MTVQQNLAVRILKRGMTELDTLSLKRSSWRQWWENLNFDPKNHLQQLQQNLIEELQFADGVSVSNTMFMDQINQWHVSNEKAVDVKIPTLMIHGYASSSMSYYRNFETLSHHIRDVYAIDLPGNGLSKELPLEVKGEHPPAIEFEQPVKHEIVILRNRIDESKYREHLQEYENYYIDTLEKWRKENNFPKVNVVGHSYGGYLSFKYAMKYPERVHKLCLVSPLGVERNMYSINNNLKENEEYEVQLNDPSKPNYINQRNIPQFLFEKQNRALRYLGPVGAKLCWGYVNSSYKRVPSISYREYVFQLVYGRGVMSSTSIEVFRHLFTRGLLAYDPVMDHMNHIKASKLMMVYGEFDWMNKLAGRAAIDEFNALRSRYDGTFEIIPNAGHNLILDNPREFDKKLVQFLKDD